MEVNFKCLSCKEGDLIQIRNFMECNKCGRQYKLPKLRKCNSIKYCRKCGQINPIIVLDLRGYCVECGEFLYTLESEKKKKR